MNNDFEFDSLVKKMAAEHQPELPSPGVIWWRAQILKKQAEKERIERPVTIMRAVAAIIGLIILAGLWISQADGIHASLSRAGGFPVMTFQIVGATIAIAFIGLMVWSASRHKSQT